MGCNPLLPLFFIIIILGNHYQNFVDTAPYDFKTATEGKNLKSWKLYNMDNNFWFFNETKEQQWNGPFFFVLGADIQFGFIARELENKKVVTWEKENYLAEELVKKINQMNPKPRFFVMCGDLCDAMPDTESEMREKQEIDFKKIFGKLDENIPLICVCGNHDIGNKPTKETIKKYRSSFGDDFFSFWCGGVLFLVINSQYFYDSSKVPDLAEEHIDWINDKLNEAQEEKKRVVVFQHIPWFLKSVDEEESYFTINKEIRKVWLDKFKKAGVEAIFCGHYHRNAGGVYKDLEIVVTSAVGGQLGNDPSGARIVKIKSFSFFVANTEFIDETVKELQNLKSNPEEAGTKNREGITINKSQSSFFSDVNGRKSSYKETKSNVIENGKLVAQLAQNVNLSENNNGEPKSVTKLEVEIPSKGIHDFLYKGDGNFEVSSDNNKRKEKIKDELFDIENEVKKMKSFSKGEYSPLDMAEYIFWTGDEKNVALTVEEFLEQGLMARKEAINFLQSIKFYLDFMREHYHDSQKITDTFSSKRKNLKEELLNNEKLKKIFFDDEKEQEKLISFDFSKSESPENVMPLIKPNEFEARPKKILDREYPIKWNQNWTEIKSVKNFLKEIGAKNDAYEGILEKPKMSDSLCKDSVNSLETVLFELAKIMFSQSLTRGNEEAQKALLNFSSFLQEEVKNGKISRNLEKEILEILITALINTLMENPELVPTRELQSFLNESLLSSDMVKQLPMPEAVVKVKDKSV